MCLSEYEGRPGWQRNGPDRRVRIKPDRLAERATVQLGFGRFDEEHFLWHGDGVLTVGRSERKAEITHAEESLGHPLSDPTEESGLPRPEWQ